MSRVLTTLLLTVYIVVALVNYSVVQSYLGAWVGNYFSKEWGGKVAIGSLHAMPWDHLILDRVQWISPTDDTLFLCESLQVNFDRFPFHDNTLEMKRVTLKNTYYHLGINEDGINLKFVIDYFKPEHPSPSKPHAPFTVKVGTLILDNVHYKMDLKSESEVQRTECGEWGAVDIPHMEFFDIRAKIKDVTVVNDDVTCQIVRFATQERSGFELKELSGKVHVSQQGIKAEGMKIKTGGSYIETDAELCYDGWLGISGYVSTVHHEAELKEGTRVSMGDVAYWAPVIGEARGTIFNDWPIVEAVGHARGTVDSMWTDMTVRWNDSTTAVVKGTVRGLPKIDTTTFNMDIDLTVRGEGAKIVSQYSPFVSQLHWVDLGATVHGGLQQHATVDIALGSNLGNLLAATTLTRSDKGYIFTLKSKSEQLTIKNEQMQIISENLDLDLTGFWKGYDLTLSEWKWLELLEGRLDARCNKLKVRSRNDEVRSESLSVEGTLKHGQLTATVASKDSLMDFDITLKGERKTELEIESDLEIRQLNAGLLPLPLKTHMTFATKGEKMETLSGTAHAEHTQYGNLYAKEIDLVMAANETNKSIELKSDIADATIYGHFSYEELPLLIKEFVQTNIPEVLRTVDKRNFEDTASDQQKANASTNLSFHLHWKHGKEVLQEVAPWIIVSEGTHIDGSYNSGEHWKLVMRCDSLKLGGISMEGVGLIGYQKDKHYLMDIEAQEVGVGKVTMMERARISIASQRQGASLDIMWGNEDVRSRGDLELMLGAGDTYQIINHEWGAPVKVEKGLFFVGETPWELSSDDMRIGMDGTRFKVKGDRLKLESGERRIGAQISLCGESYDHVKLDFERFNLGLISDIFLQESPLSVNGDINGTFSLYGVNETPYFNANLMIDSCMINNQALDTVRLISNWNAELNLLNLNLDSRQVTAGGFMTLGKKETGMQFNVDFSGFELALVAPFLTSFSSLFEGQLHGNFDIGGTLDRPLIHGEAFVDNGALKVDFTNVTYRFSDSIQFDNNEVTLRNFDFEDPLGNKATANGKIMLMNENAVELDISLTTNDLLILDKKGGDQFYGKLLASANGRVSGTNDHLDINVTARTNPGCELTVPITQQQQVKSQHYITFVNDYEPLNIAEVSTTDSSFNYTLNLDLSITPDLKLNLPMNFENVGANASMTGSGDLHLSLEDNASPQLMGNYAVSSGTMKVALLSLYEKRFTIKPGSSLNFPGEISNARFDVQAAYSQRVNLSTLTGSLSNIDNSQKYIQVENIIAIAGTLNDPSINFDINLPYADQSVQEEVFAYIDRNSERDMLNQTVSLLVNGKFSNVNNNDQTGGNALDFVTSFVGNSLSDMVQFVDVNIDYKAATENTNQHVDVNISKDWGRWYLESTLGYGGESRAMEQSSVNGTVIDALIGYRVSPVFHLYAYNRTNTNDYTRIDLPFKQGAGMKLTKDFDHWKDLFKRKTGK